MSDKYGKDSNDIVDDLGSLKPEKQKAAVKKVISAMTIGRDVSKLFPHIVKCIATQDNELKKLVYLYIINFARIRPSESILAVNHFKMDSSASNPNPLMRALAVRTMGCLGVEEIMQFLCDPLKEALKDRDPYVRKTAVLCVAKIYDVNRQLVEEQFCFIDVLNKLIENEGNSMVIANAVASLLEISSSKGADVLKMNWKKTKCLLNSLHENNEWCQVYLLEGISKYYPQNQEEVNEVIERVVPMVSHSNSGVVLTTIKILIKLLDMVQTPDTIRSVCKKITPSLVTLLSSEKEIQYVALKNINILIQKRPIIFEKDIKMFFCNFTEPIYNKMEKLEILYKLVTVNNIDNVLNELKEYACEVDVQFVKRSVRLIGQCAIKLEKAAQRCVETLVELVKTQISFVIQEAIIALRDVFRRYPNTFEGAMQIVNENLRTLNDASSKSALIWIIGEYADRIDGAEAQLTKFLDNLKEESYDVQLQILNAAVKTYLKVQSEEAFNILNDIFEYTNNQTDNVDLRERGYIYYRLLELDPAIACTIILSDKPRISEEANVIEGSLLDKLVDNLGTLSTIYVKPPESFVKKTKKIINLGDEEEVENEELAFNVGAGEGSMKKTDMFEPGLHDIDHCNTNQNMSKSVAITQSNQQQNDNIDLLGLGFSSNSKVMNGSTNPNSNQISQSNTQNQNNNNFTSNTANTINLLDSLFVSPSSQVQSKIHAVIPKKTVLDENIRGTQGNSGLVIEASVQRDNNLYLILKITNRSNLVINGFEIQFNTNYFGISVMNNSLRTAVLNIGATNEFKIDLFSNVSPDYQKPPNTEPYLLQSAIRCDLDEYFFQIPVLFLVLFETEKISMTMEDFIASWQTIQTKPEMCMNIDISTKYQQSKNIINRFENNNLSLVNKKELNGQEQLYFVTKLTNGQFVYLSTAYSYVNPNAISIIAKIDIKDETKVIALILQSIRFLLNTEF